MRTRRHLNKHTKRFRKNKRGGDNCDDLPPNLNEMRTFDIQENIINKCCLKDATTPVCVKAIKIVNSRRNPGFFTRRKVDIKNMGNKIGNYVNRSINSFPESSKSNYEKSIEEERQFEQENAPYVSDRGVPKKKGFLWGGKNKKTKKNRRRR
jgi:hypothetical protein